MAQRFKPVSVPTKLLSEGITSSATSFKLNNIENWQGDDLVAGDFSTYSWAIFKSIDGSRMEIMRIDPSTIASASITIVKRGLPTTGSSATYDTEVTANKLDWGANETYVELGSNPPQVYNEYIEKNGTQTINDIWTFSSTGRPKLDSDVDTLDDAEFVSKGELTRTALGTLTNNRIIVSGNAGEAVVAGQLVYLDSTDTEWKLCDADTAATVENVMLGIAQGTGSNGVAITGGVLLKGVDSNQTGLTINSIYYAGNTAGAIVATPGTVEVTIGVSLSATQLYFYPRFNQGITEDQQDALAGTSGTPSSTNKYVTNADTAENTASKLVRRKSDGTIGGINYTSKEFVAGESIIAGNAVSAGFYFPSGSVTYDSKIQANGTLTSAGGTFNNNVTVANNSDRILVVFLHSTASSDLAITMTYNAVGLTEVQETVWNSTSRLRTFVLYAPATGTNVLATTFAAGASVSYAIHAYSYYNVANPIGNTAEASYSGTSPSVTITPDTDGAVILTSFGGPFNAAYTSLVNMANNALSTTTNMGLYTADCGIAYPRIATTMSATSASTPQAINTLTLKPTGTYTQCILKSSAAAVTNACNIKKYQTFAGFADAAGNAGESISVRNTGVFVTTGLTEGATHFLSDTGGAIAATAGTNSAKIGLALSATELLIKHDNV